MTNEVDDFQLVDHVGVLGTADRNKARSMRELMKRRPQEWLDFENGIVGTPFASYTTGLSSVSSTITTSLKSCVSISNSGSSTAIAAIHTLASPTASSGSMWFAGRGATTLEWNVSIDQLSNATNEFGLRVGFMDLANGLDGNSVCFEYLRTSSVNWRIRCSKAGTVTVTNTTTAVAAGFVTLRMEIDAAGANVDFYVNDNLIGSITTNIPNAVSNACGLVMVCNRSAGTVSVTFKSDWVSYDIRLTTPRA